VSRSRTTGTMRGMNAALAVGPDDSKQLPHTSRRQLAIALVVTVAVIAAAVFVVRYFIADSNSYDGAVQQGHATQVNFLSPGKIVDLPVSPGQHVHKGEVLARQDSTAAQAALKSAESVLSQAEEKLAFLQSPQLSSAQKQQAQLGVEQARSALSGDQSAARDAQQALDAANSSADEAVQSATSQLTADQTQFAHACPHGVGAPPTPGSEPGTVQIYVNCQNLAAQITRDQKDVSTARSAQSTTVQRAQQQLDSANAAVADDEAALASAQNQPASQAAALTSPGAIADAKASVATAQSQLAAAKSELASTTIVAPSDGLVADVAAVVGEFADSNGVHNYPGPQTTTNQNAPTYSLFPATGDTGGTSTTVSEYPVITFYPDTGTQVLAEVPENAVHSFTKGAKVNITIHALSITVPGIVDYAVPVPVRQSSGVSYQVLISFVRLPASVLPGMSVSVTR